ncbi:Juvenile hormone epoxide hydrolase 1, partial [Pseudolycoriella hygida]
MNMSTKFFLAVTCAGIGYVYIILSRPLPVPDLDFNHYWGPGEPDPYKEDASIKEQEIHFDDAIINKLRKRLNESINFQPPLEGVEHQYGINTNTLVTFANYWKNDYMNRWPERLKFLNSLPHFMTEIQGLKIHFIRVKPQNPEGKRVVPVLLLHGWPGSVREFYEFIPMLTNSNKESPVAFEVIAPSLPGYGFSQGASKTGFGPAEIAVVLRNLMLRIGHRKFVVQGGDWGSIIGSNVATLFPQNVIAYHSNFCVVRSPLSTIKLIIASLWPPAFVDEKFARMVFPLTEKFQTLIEESGYFHIQATKPDTIGTALQNSPIGLAAYILEKFISCFPDHDMDEVLDNIMIYYLTKSFTTSARLYKESVLSVHSLERVQTHVPVGCTRFPIDILQALDWQLKDKFTNIVHSTWQEKGGHFAAMEVPQLLYKDFIEFAAKIFK